MELSQEVDEESLLEFEEKEMDLTRTFSRRDFGESSLGDGAVLYARILARNELLLRIFLPSME
jgi:hypothetical protein